MGLRQGDLKDLIRDVFEVDSFQSKMGDDGDIVVVSFSVHEDQAAKDLTDFIEKGYDFVLDADNTSGEQRDGDYKVFVEIARNRHVNEQIMELLDGVGKLSAIENFKFRYYKSFRSVDANIDNLQEMVPIDANTYDIVVNEANMNNYKNFFNKSFVDNVNVINDTLTVKKIYADEVKFQIKDFGPTERINETLEKINMNDYAEILFLTKYLGDYNVTKFGSKTLTLENNGHTLVVERL
jgi:hypothetical protein